MSLFTTAGGVSRDRVTLRIMALLFLVMPLYRTGALEDSFITPKIALTLVLLFLLFLALLVSSRRDSLPETPASHRSPCSVAICFALFVLVNAASAAWCACLPMAVHGILYIALFFILYLACRMTLRTPSDVRFVFAAGFLSAVLTALWTLFEDTFPAFDKGIVPLLSDWRGFLAAGLGNSGHIAGLIGLFLPGMIFLFLLRPRFSPLTAIGIIICFAAQIVTWSVGSTASFIISFFLWSVILLNCKRVRPLVHWKRAVLLLAAGIALAAFYLLPHRWNPHQPSLWAQAFHSQRWADGWPTRVAIWETTWHIIKSHTLLGIGAGNFTYVYPSQVVPAVWSDPALRPYAGAFTNEAHNEYLQIWAETGLPGLAAWFALILFFFRAVYTRMTRRCSLPELLMLTASGAGVTMFLLDSLMTFPIRLPSHFASFAFFLAAVSIGTKTPSPEDPSPRPNRPMARRSAIALILLFLAFGIAIVGRRIAAEYFLKSGRSAVEETVIRQRQGYMSAWSIADSCYKSALADIAEGRPESQWKNQVSQMKTIAGISAFDEARRSFEKALAWDPWYANAGSRLGSLLLFQGKYRESLDVNKRTLQTLDAYEIHERMGAAWFFSGNTDRAIREWTLVRQRYGPLASFMQALLTHASPPPSPQ